MSQDFSTLTAEQRALLALLLRKKASSRAEKEAHAPPLRPARRAGQLPLSFAQQRLWFLDQLEPNSSFYNIPLAVRLRGRLNVSALECSFNEIVRRHETLRTTFSNDEDGQPVQIIAEHTPVRLTVEDLSPLAADEREAFATRLACEEGGRSFDLSAGPLLRVRLLRLAEDEHVVLATMHHIVSDAWSMRVLVKEVAALYDSFNRGEPLPLEELPIQYADYAVWQRQWLQSEALEEHLGYWKAQLAGAPTFLELPTDRPRLAMQTYHGAVEQFELSAEVSQRLREMSRSEGTTLFMVMLATFQLLLSYYSGQEDILVGAPTANRSHIETEALIGFFINMLVLRADLSGDPPFRELLRRVKEATLGAYAHQEAPFEKLVEKLQHERKTGQTPWVRVAVDFETVQAEPLKLASLNLEPFGENNTTTAKFDLVLNVQGAEQQLRGSMIYNTDLFNATTIKRMLGHLDILFRSALSQPEARLSELKLIVAEAERRLHLDEKSQLKEKRRRMLKGARPEPVRSSFS